MKTTMLKPGDIVILRDGWLLHRILIKSYTIISLIECESLPFNCVKCMILTDDGELMWYRMHVGGDHEVVG